MDLNKFKAIESHKRPSAKELDQFLQKSDLKLRKLQKKIANLHEAINAEGRDAVLVIFQAMDAAGKDSTIRNVFNMCDLAGLNNVSFKQPSKRESEQDFLWRCHEHTPRKGQLTIFNRSYYEEVLVVKVHPEWLGNQKIDDEINDAFWKKRYESINNFETHLNNSGTKIIKFMLDVSQEEQHKRLRRRYKLVDKQYKFSVGDLKESRLWGQYQNAFNEMLINTSTKANPWYVIPADDKEKMRKIVAKIVETELKSLKPKFPDLEKFDESDYILINELMNSENSE